METITDVALAEIQAEVHGSKTKRELTDKLDGLPGVIMARIAADKVDFSATPDDYTTITLTDA